VVACSEVASANDYVEKEVQFNNGNKQIVILLSKTCDAIAYDTFQIWYGRGFSDEVSREKANTAKSDCESMEKPKELVE
jgi:hypothetical protein